MKVLSWFKRAPIVVAVALALAVVGMVLAYPGGKIGYSGNPATGGVYCTQCHYGGVTPDVRFSGPSIVKPGETVDFSFIISGGQETAGGFNVSADNGEIDNLPGALDTRTQVEPQTQRVEITHTAPKDVDSNKQVIFTFRWTAPDTPGIATFYGAGNSVNLSGDPSGDAAAKTARTIAVLEEVTDQIYLPAAIR